MNNLPKVLIRYICNYILLDDLNNLSLVCKKMNNIIFSYKATKYFINLKYLFSIYNVDTNICNKYYDSFTNIIISEDNKKEDNKKCVGGIHVYNHIINLENFIDLLKKFKQDVNTIILDKSCYSIKPLFNVNLKNLKRIISYEYLEEDNIVQLLSINCPNLEYFDTFYDYDGNGIKYINNLTNLKNLTIACEGNRIPTNLYGLSKLCKLKIIIPYGICEFTLDDKNLNELTEIEIDLENSEEVSVGVKIMIKSEYYPKLTKLTIVNGCINTIAMTDTIFENLKFLSFCVSINENIEIIPHMYPSLQILQHDINADFTSVKNKMNKLNIYKGCFCY